MRLAALYLRSRLAGHAFALLGLIAAATALTLWYSGGAEFIFGLILVAMPLAAAVVIAAGARAPFGESEQAAGYALPALRLGHLLGLLAWAACGLVLAATLWPPSALSGLTPPGELVRPGAVAWWLARNLLGFAGVALLGARWLGSGRAWAIPLVHGMLTLASLPETLFGWPMRPGSDREAAVIAIVLLSLGLAAIVRKGAREDSSDGAVA